MQIDATDTGNNEDYVALGVGETIGRYRVLGVLGRGGFGITYRARDGQLEREVAIKEYLPIALAVRAKGTMVAPSSTAAAEDFAWGKQRFVDEGRILAGLPKAGAIVRVHDFLEANGTAYIVMELVRGTTLEKRLGSGGVLTPEQVDRILWPLLDGLEQVHEAGFLHRDIKPANILLDQAGAPTLIDFGAARAAIAARNSDITALFTPGYGAAEQFTSGKQGPWTDIYGLSATIYHAISGSRPPSAFDRLVQDECRPLAELAAPGFAPGLLAGIDRGLAVRSGDRPQTIAEWRDVLKAGGRAAAGDVTVLLRDGSASVPRRSSGRRLARWGAVAAVALLAGTAGVLLLGKRSTDWSAGLAQPPDIKAVQLQAEELARLRAEKESRDKAEAEAAQRKAAEAAAAAEAEAEQRRAFEADLRNRLAAIEAAARQKAEEEERIKAEDARRKAAESDPRAAEAGEVALALSLADRQRVQVALSALGFDTKGADGVFGPLTRSMVASWQKARGYPPTGFLTGPENQALLLEAVPAVARLADQAKKSEPAVSSAPSATSSASASAPPHPSGGGARLAWPNMETRLVWYGNWRDCNEDRLPTIDIVVPPTNGKVEVRPTTALPAGCTRELPAVGVFYTPRTGYTGPDSVAYNVRPDSVNVKSLAGTHVMKIEVKR